MSIIFIEGVSGIGKTTSCHKSFDFSKYLEQFPKYFEKHEKPYLQTIYDNHINLDLISYLMELNQDEKNDVTKNLYLDRCFISQFVYLVLFKYRGQFNHPDVFAADLDKFIFSDKNLMNLLKRGLEDLFRIVEKITDRPVELYWCVSKNPNFTTQVVRARKGFETSLNKEEWWNIFNYVCNQNYIFKQLFNNLHVGKYIEIDSFLDLEKIKSQ